jgi:hypothetical protein
MSQFNEDRKERVLRLSAALAEECETGKFRLDNTSPIYVAWLLRLLIEMVKEKS